MPMRVTSLRLYAVKSMAGVDVDHADVEPWGLAGDRRWGVVDNAGASITARKIHSLLGLRAEPAAQNAVRISDRNGDSMVVQAPHAAGPVPVGHSRQGHALPAGEEIGDWLTARLGVSVRLVWQDNPGVRSIAEHYGGRPGDSLSLADAGPLLLASEASLAQLQQWIRADAGLPDVPDIDPSDISGNALLASPLSILRFRPNVVVDGGAPFAEEAWSTVRIGDVEFRKTMVCDRCVMTTIDPVTLNGGKEPIRSLARHRRRDGKTWFGIRLAPVSAGRIHVGDAVEASGGVS
jgi:uncharacterized protein YcbX